MMTLICGFSIIYWIRVAEMRDRMSRHLFLPRALIVHKVLSLPLTATLKSTMRCFFSLLCFESNIYYPTADAAASYFACRDRANSFDLSRRRLLLPIFQFFSSSAVTPCTHTQHAIHSQREQRTKRRLKPKYERMKEMCDKLMYERDFTIQFRIYRFKWWPLMCVYDVRNAKTTTGTSYISRNWAIKI